jgi:hypothetical protein
MKTFTLFWLDGKREIVQGDSYANAMTKAGYGNGTLPALDFHASGDSKDYVWDEKLHRWKLTLEAQIGKIK